jgi:putative transposase
VIDFIALWSLKTQIPAKRFVHWLGISESKFHQWKKRYGKANEHNGSVPRDHWLEPWEKARILAFYYENRDEGYRRLTYMMLDAGEVAVSASTVYRVLSRAGVLRPWGTPGSKRGTGFQQPLRPHQHWHIDMSYLNIRGTFYYMTSILDGYSRAIIHHEIRETMTQEDVQIIVQRALERYEPVLEACGVTPRIISDNGPQFVGRDFRFYLRQKGMDHVTTSPYYPESNGKIERYHRTIKSECIRPMSPLSLGEARRVVDEFVRHYNEVRLHSAIGYVTPLDKLNGREEAIFRDRDRRLEAARERRAANRRTNATSLPTIQLSATTENSVFG